MATEPKTLFSVTQDADGALSVNWHPSMYPLLSENRETTDRVIDLVEEILETDDEE